MFQIFFLFCCEEFTFNVKYSAQAFLEGGAENVCCADFVYILTSMLLIFYFSFNVGT